MAAFEPFIFFRFFLSILFAFLLVYDCVAFMVWYRGLPRFIQRIIILKFLQVRTGRLKWEAGAIGILLVLEGWLLAILFGGG
ncbi:MAG TPA: hypothetical protein VIU33_02755 [Nitrospiria bacterium]